MSESKSNIPKLRFPGFTGPWEQRKFVSFVIPAGVRNKDSLPLKSYSVSNDRGFVPQDEQFEQGGSMRDADKSAYWIVEPGSFAYNPARINVGSIGYLSTGENVIVSSLYEVFRADDTCNDRFLWHWFKSPLFARQIEMLQEGGVRLYFFFDKLLKSEIWMPDIEEQTVVARFFDQIDNLITLRQRELDHTKLMKRGLLQKMFPKDGADVPELRFPGFTGSWEQRKLGDEFSFLRNNTLSRAELSISRGTTFDVHYGDVLVAFGSVVNPRVDKLPRIASDDVALSLSCDRLRDGDVIIADTAEDFTAGKCSELRGVGELTVFSGLHTIPLRPLQGYAPGFLGYCLNAPAYRKQLVPLMQGVKVISISRVALTGTVLTAPSLPEQRAIGAFFSSVDDLIALRQRELEHMKLLKKALLQQMFV